MVRLNVLVILSFIICLDVLNSYPNYDEFIQIYMKQLETDIEFRMVYKPGRSLFYENVCNSPREQLAALCNNVIRRLRTEYQVYNNLYMNYLPYNVQKPPCRDVKVWISQTNVLAHQKAVNCFARPLVLALESSEKMAHFYQKIVVYPHSTTKVIAFECNENENYCTLLKYYPIHWKKLHVADSSLFYTPIPQGWSNVPELYSILHPIHSTLNHHSANPNNIINSSYGFTFFKICFVAFRAENYNKNWNADSKYSKQPPLILQATLRDPVSIFNLSFSIMAHTCENSISEDTTFMNKYHVAAGPGDHSVILLEEVGNDDNSGPRYEIIEFVENLTKNYMYHFFYYSY